MSKTLSRRTFLKSAAGLSAGFALPLIVPASALGNQKRVAANNRITLGLIGVGGMGSAHLHGFKGNREVEILAVCDVDEGKRRDAQKAVGGSCAAYTDYRDLLDRDDIDAVVVSAPDHWRAEWEYQNMSRYWRVVQQFAAQNHQYFLDARIKT